MTPLRSALFSSRLWIAAACCVSLGAADAALAQANAGSGPGNSGSNTGADAAGDDPTEGIAQADYKSKADNATTTIEQYQSAADVAAQSDDPKLKKCAQDAKRLFTTKAELAKKKASDIAAAIKAGDPEKARTDLRSALQNLSAAQEEKARLDACVGESKTDPNDSASQGGGQAQFTEGTVDINGGNYWYGNESAMNTSSPDASSGSSAVDGAAGDSTTTSTTTDTTSTSNTGTTGGDSNTTTGPGIVVTPTSTTTDDP